MAIIDIKENGEYIGFDEQNKLWVYAVGTVYYAVNKSGVFKI